MKTKPGASEKLCKIFELLEELSEENTQEMNSEDENEA